MEDLILLKTHSFSQECPWTNIAETPDSSGALWYAFEEGKFTNQYKLQFLNWQLSKPSTASGFIIHSLNFQDSELRESHIEILCK